MTSDGRSPPTTERRSSGRSVCGTTNFGRSRVPDPHSYQLTDDELLAAFDCRGGVRDFVFGGAAPQAVPRMVLLGAQPAAGKSQAMAGVRQRYGPDTVPLTGDHLRVFHPRFEEIMGTLPPEQAELVTGQASGRWVRMCLEHARDNSYSLILEGVFRDPGMTLRTAEEFSQAGFTVELVAVAVREERSRLDGVHRYLNSGDGPGRWTPSDRHDLAYAMMRETLALAEASPHVSRIALTNRSGEDLYTNERTPDGQWGGRPAAVAALDGERALPLPPVEALLWQSRYRDVLLTMATRGEIDEISRPVLQRLTHDADAIARMVDSDPTSATRREHEAVGPLLRALANGALPGTQTAESLLLVTSGRLAEQKTADEQVRAEAERRAALPSELGLAEEELRTRIQERLPAVVADQAAGPYGSVPDADLAATLARVTEEAAAARNHAVHAESRAAGLAAALAPGGEVEQGVTERARQVDAILDARYATELVERLSAEVGQAREQAAEIERQLAERGVLGRQVVRGADREALGQRAADLLSSATQKEDELIYARDRLESARKLAGPADKHDAVLGAWQEAGGGHAEVLARTAASRQRGVEAARAEAREAQQRASGLGTSVGLIHQELDRRGAQPPAQRAAEDAQRVLTAQRLAQQSRQTRQDGPGLGREGQSRSGPSASR
ncbi:zeta toxin family protein [Kitasatospora sp. NPDC093550]|uniref:zeta toxin family protein n=1 Tax=Kitasatospora sp. NPDC093550 TaxID=3364089 RepID=UPI00381D0204